ncbi:MAG: M3 family oligoendopeptidase [Fimbriimonadaceae bacterium]|nr:M3 family oligoendopeptidase [Fimbriimonadaceae bacterium]
MTTTHELPRWDLEVFFPSVDSPEFLSAIAELAQKLEEWDSLGKAAKTDDLSPRLPSPDLANHLVGLIEAVNTCSSKFQLIGSFLSNHCNADTENEGAKAARSRLTPHRVKFSRLATELTAWIGSLPIEELLPLHPTLEAHAFPLRRAQKSARFLMSMPEESLVAELSESSSSAWSNLHRDVTSRIEVEVDGEKLPMSAVRNLAYDQDQGKRKRAYEAELVGWQAHAIPIAAAMNSIKGGANVLGKRRGWESQLDLSLFGNNMDRESLEAMLTAARESFPAFRRYFRAKAKLLGHSAGLPWYDLFAPVGQERSFSYDEGMAFVVEGFGSYSQEMADFARRSFDENWIDVAPRKGKVDGAYCSGVTGDISRILMNYKPSFGSVSTLAHELGHAYHNLCLSQRTPMMKSTPMTLAETASIFCETIIKKKATSTAEGQELMAILEASLQGQAQVVVDITSRYLFETQVIELRKERAQKDTYGDGLDPDTLHPYMWAMKPHYYSYSAFYNYPYMFGLLFSLGLYRVYSEQPNGFHERYDDLLSSTGLDNAAELTERFGIDIRETEFWRGSLKVIEEDIDSFVSLVG